MLDPARDEIYRAISNERFRQEDLKRQGRFAYTCADEEMSHLEFLAVIAEEIGEVAHEINEGIGPGRSIDETKLMREVIQVAAVCVARVELMTKQGVKP